MTPFDLLPKEKDKTMNLIKIDPKEIAIFVEEGGKFLFKPSAEVEFDKLIQAQEMLNKAVEDVLEGIKKAGEKINPDFKGVKGEKYNLTKRQYGSRYTYKKAKTGSLGAFLKNKNYDYVNAEAVDKYLEELGELPDGVEEKQREYKMSIRRKNEN